MSALVFVVSMIVGCLVCYISKLRRQQRNAKIIEHQIRGTRDFDIERSGSENKLVNLAIVVASGGQVSEQTILQDTPLSVGLT